jgi:hypothetical protein
MRVTSLLAVLACGLVSLISASAQTTGAPPSKPNQVEAAVGIIRPPDFLDSAEDSSDRDRHSDSERDKVCYMLRTYRMKRERPDSDVTERDGYSTCQRASKFGVKKAEQAEKPSSH